MAKESKENRILQAEKQLLQEEKGLLENLNAHVQKLADAIERTRIDEYTSMVRRPWRFFWFNFMVGVFRGVGMAVGMTVIAALILYIAVRVLSGMVELPIIGMYIAEIVKFVNQYLQQGLPAR